MPVVSGKLIDDRGAPVAGALLYAKQARRTEGTPFERLSDEVVAETNAARLAAVVTGADGSFRCACIPARSAWRLALYRDGRSSDSFPFDGAAAPVELVMK